MIRRSTLSLCGLLALPSGSCIVQGGEEESRNDDTFYVNVVHWEATNADGAAVGSGCVLPLEADYGKHIAFAAVAGQTITLSETFRTFHTTGDDYSAHPDEAYWCNRSDGVRPYT